MRGRFGVTRGSLLFDAFSSWSRGMVMCPFLRFSAPLERHHQHHHRLSHGRCRPCTVVARNPPWTKRLQPRCRRLLVLLDRPSTTASNVVSYSSTLRGCPKKFSLVDSGGLVSSTAHFLVLIAAFKSRFTNSIRFSPLVVVLTSAPSPRTFALLSVCSSVSAPYFFISSGLRWHFSISTL